jgi:tryptophan-rich sensory protein
MSTLPDITLVLSLLTFVFWQMSKTSMKEMRQIYGKNQLIPPYVFGIVWTILYVCIVLSGYFSMSSAIVQDQYYLARFIFFVVNLFLNKFWSVLFFDMRLYGWQSILTIVLILATGIVYLVLAGLSFGLTLSGTTEHTYLIVSIVLFTLYMTWCVIALVLNWRFKPSDETLPILKSVESKISSGKLKRGVF